jgi:preprotein translocase subunit SecB
MPKKKAKSSEQPANQSYEKFLRSVRLVAMGLRECHCRLDRMNYYRVMEQKLSLTRVNAEHKLSRAASGHFDADGSISVTIEDRKKKEQVLSVTCSFEAHFHAEFEAGSSFPEQFANGELRLILFPYFREMVSDLTARMAIRQVLLPLSNEE